MFRVLIYWQQCDIQSVITPLMREPGQVTTQDVTESYFYRIELMMACTLLGFTYF